MSKVPRYFNVKTIRVYIIYYEYPRKKSLGWFKFYSSSLSPGDVEKKQAVPKTSERIRSSKESIRSSIIHNGSKNIVYYYFHLYIYNLDGNFRVYAKANLNNETI